MLLLAVVFLPLFLLGSAAEVKLSVANALEPLTYQASAAAVIYLSMIVPALLGSIVHTAALLLIPPGVVGWPLRITAVVLAPLVPLTVVLPGLSGGVLLSSLFGATTVATLTYGLVCRVQVRGRPTSQERGVVTHKSAM